MTSYKSENKMKQTSSPIPVHKAKTVWRVIASSPYYDVLEAWALLGNYRWVSEEENMPGLSTVAILHVPHHPNNGRMWAALQTIGVTFETSVKLHPESGFSGLSDKPAKVAPEVVFRLTCSDTCFDNFEVHVGGPATGRSLIQIHQQSLWFIQRQGKLLKQLQSLGVEFKVACRRVDRASGITDVAYTMDRR